MDAMHKFTTYELTPGGEALATAIAVNILTEHWVLFYIIFFVFFRFSFGSAINAMRCERRTTSDSSSIDGGGGGGETVGEEKK